MQQDHIKIIKASPRKGQKGQGDKGFHTVRKNAGNAKSARNATFRIINYYPSIIVKNNKKQ
jgi:hypothetical protein